MQLYNTSQSIKGILMKGKKHVFPPWSFLIFLYDLVRETELNVQINYPLIQIHMDEALKAEATSLPPKFLVFRQKYKWGPTCQMSRLYVLKMYKSNELKYIPVSCLDRDISITTWRTGFKVRMWVLRESLYQVPWLLSSSSLVQNQL